jgi:hypothetical protein
MRGTSRSRTALFGEQSRDPASDGPKRQPIAKIPTSFQRFGPAKFKEGKESPDLQPT